MKTSGGGDEGVDGQQTEARWAVDEDVVEVARREVIGEGAPEPHLPSHQRHQLDLGAGQVDGRRGAVEPLDRWTRNDDLGERLPVHQNVVDAGHLGVMVDPEGRARIALRVKVDDEDLETGLSQRGGDVDGGGGLADAALLVGDREDPRRRWGRGTGGRPGRDDGARPGPASEQGGCQRPPRGCCSPVPPADPRVFHVKPGRRSSRRAVFHVKQASRAPLRRDRSRPLAQGDRPAQ